MLEGTLGTANTSEALGNAIISLSSEKKKKNGNNQKIVGRF